MHGRAIIVFLACALWAGQPGAQEVQSLPGGQVTPEPLTDALPQATVRSPLLTIDTDRLFNDTQFGQRVARDLGQARDALAQENAAVAAELTEEERSLAQRRPGMDIDDFRAEAEAFDQKVQRIRAEQDAKERALQQGVGTARDAFLAAASPVLGTLMMESGAAVILDRRSVFLGVAAVDITDEAIAAIDEALGEGEGLVQPETFEPSAALPGVNLPTEGGGTGAE